MIFLDSNIVIYSAQTAFAHLRPLVYDPNNQVSAFTMLEVLGFHALTPSDKLYFESAFTILDVKDISKTILQQAIRLRQRKQMSPGDAIIAASALHFGSKLYTRNVTDFNWIPELTVFNPL
jgi:predicted nucleic acid-binding protein